jgi:hypothetical protein
MLCPSCQARESSRSKVLRPLRRRTGEVLSALAAEPLPWLSARAARRAGKLEPNSRAYTPKHLVEKILTSRSAIEGERLSRRRQLTGRSTQAAPGSSLET